MKYFFVLGNHPALSVAELEAVLPGLFGQYYAPNILVAEHSSELDAGALLTQLGGTIKMGKVVKEIDYTPHALFLASLEILQSADKAGKFNFGLSYYGSGKVETRKLGLALKQELKNQGVSCRLVVSREKTLSSVVVEQNKLVRSGRELVYLQQGKKLLIGITEAVQPFKALSARDYGRPARDDRSGMLPPKLAQMMINLAQGKKDDTLLDPFCGSGTIITEAMLLGYKHIIGSDISAKAITDSQANSEWIYKKYGGTLPTLTVHDARELNKVCKPASVGAIVTETYLGPQRGTINIQKVSAELSVLYQQVLQELFRILKPGAKAVIALPAFITRNQPQLLPLNSKPFKVVGAAARVTAGMTARHSFLYGRPEQRVWREIVVLEK